MKLIANVCMYNEVEKGNLNRCLTNLTQYCDEIIVYDDASTDDSIAVAESYGCRVIAGEVNDQMNELAHKRLLLNVSVALGATHVFWLDCDEVVERAGTEGGIRELCLSWPEEVDAFRFPEINLWRSGRWVRTDSLFAKGHFVRLWRVVPGIHFNVVEGVHNRLYPATIKNVHGAPFGVIHYGFHDYLKMMVKIGAHGFTKEELVANATTNWILNETECSCYFLTDEKFPVECVPSETWPQPQPRALEDLKTYAELTSAVLG